MVELKRSEALVQESDHNQDYACSGLSKTISLRYDDLIIPRNGRANGAFESELELDSLLFYRALLNEHHRRMRVQLEEQRVATTLSRWARAAVIARTWSAHCPGPPMVVLSTNGSDAAFPKECYRGPIFWEDRSFLFARCDPNISSIVGESHKDAKCIIVSKDGIFCRSVTSRSLLAAAFQLSSAPQLSTEILKELANALYLASVEAHRYRSLGEQPQWLEELRELELDYQPRKDFIEAALKQAMRLPQSRLLSRVGEEASVLDDTRES